MVSNLPVVRLATNIFRNRFMVAQEWAGTYRPSLSQNKEKLIELVRENAERAGKSELARKLKVFKGYYTLEMAPPSGVDDMKKAMDELKLAQEFIKAKAFTHMTVKQAWLFFLIGLEVFLWFFVGETIGKWHIVGYKV